jgi:hypothetical protein
MAHKAEQSRQRDRVWSESNETNETNKQLKLNNFSTGDCDGVSFSLSCGEIRLPTVRSNLSKINLFDSSQQDILLNEVKCGHDPNPIFI